MQARMPHAAIPDLTLPDLDLNQGKEAELAFVKYLLQQFDTTQALIHLEEYALAIQTHTITQLIKLTRKQSHHLALHILLETARHPLFLGSEAHQLITDEIIRENYNRSVFCSHHPKTFAFIHRYHFYHPRETEDFLLNPEHLLIWIDQAPALEIGKLIECYYPAGTAYYAWLAKLAEKECIDKTPGKAVICFSLMHPGRLDEDQLKHLQAAMTHLHETEPHRFKHITASINLRLHFDIAHLIAANGYFANANHLVLQGINLDNLKLNGAKLKESDFSNASAQAASFMHAQLDKALFINTYAVSCNFQGACLIGANFSGSNLFQADFRDANLQRANFTNANLYQADLTNADLHLANLQVANFFSKSSFKFPETVDAEFYRLHKMLAGHVYKKVLFDAVLNSLIRHAQDIDIPLAYRLSILKLADKNPLFSTHEENHYLKSISNTLTSSLFSYLSKATNNNQEYLTEAQIIIRQTMEALHPNITATLK